MPAKSSVPRKVVRQLLEQLQARGVSNVELARSLSLTLHELEQVLSGERRISASELAGLRSLLPVAAREGLDLVARLSDSSLASSR
jgi:plasmid maintenance system antidote protein VapI